METLEVKGTVVYIQKVFTSMVNAIGLIGSLYLYVTTHQILPHVPYLELID